jgi:hypothetical protein
MRKGRTVHRASLVQFLILCNQLPLKPSFLNPSLAANRAAPALAIVSRRLQAGLEAQSGENDG